jgi:hypothetical protein
MADVEKTVSVVFEADLSKLKKAMAEASSFTKEMQTSAMTMRKEGIRGAGTLEKITKRVTKEEKKTKGKAALKAEKDLQKQIRRTVNDMKQKAKAFKKNALAIKEEQRALSHLITSLKKVRKERVKAFGKTRMERVREALQGANVRGGALAGGMLRKVGGLLMGGIISLLGSAFGLFTGQLTQGYQQRAAYGQAYGRLAGMGGKLGNIQRQRGFGVKMGFGPIEMAGMAAPVARATGVVGGGALRQAMAFQRATGMDTGATAGFMGTLTQAGRGFGGRAGIKGKQDLIKTLALGVHSGLDRARMPEFFGSVSTLVQRQMGVTAGEVDPTKVARILQQFGASGLPGLQGARGGQVLAALDAAIRSPGGGEAGQALTLQAFGFGKPGGTAAYYEALRRQEQGVFGEGNLQAIFGETGAQYGGGQAQILALREMTGLTINQLEALRDVVDSNLSQDERTKAIKKIEEESKSLEEQALEQQREFGDTTKHIAHLQDRSIGIGQEIKVAVERIQEVFNKAIIKALPIIVGQLTKTAEIVEAIYRFLESTLPELLGDDVEAEAKKERQATIAQWENLKKRMAVGKIKGLAAEKEMTEIQEKFQTLNMRMFRDRGAAEYAAEDFEQFYTEIGRGMGFSMGKTDIERRHEEQKKNISMLSAVGGARQALAGRDWLSGTLTWDQRQTAAAGLSKLSTGQRARYEELSKKEAKEYIETQDVTLRTETKEILDRLLELGSAIHHTADEQARAGRQQGSPAQDRGTTKAPDTSGGTQVR